MTPARIALRTTRRSAVAIVGMIALVVSAAGSGNLSRAAEPGGREQSGRTPVVLERFLVGWTLTSIPCGIAGGVILLSGVAAILLYRRGRVLAANEERLRTALAAANQGLYDLNVQTGECVINPEYARMLGYDPETFHETNAAWRERLHPEDREAVYQVYEDYVAGRRAEYRVEFRQRTATGGWKWILSCGEVVSRSSDGRPLRMRGTHTDITERKRVEEKLRLQSSALKAAAHGIVITNQRGDIEWVNPAFTTITGYPAAEVIGQNPRVLKSDQHDETFYRRMWETIRAGKVWHGELVNRRKDGSLYPEEQTITPVRDGRGEITHFIGIKLDISERRNAEELLRKTHEELRQLLAHSPAVIYRLQIKGTRFVPVMVSDNFSRLLGVTVPQALQGGSKWWLGQLHPDDRDRVLARWREVLGTGAGSCEYRLRHQNGNFRWLEDHWQVIYDARQQPAELVGVWLDITERKNLEVQFLRAQRMEGIGALASGIAHDLNNILAPVLMIAPLLRETTSDAESRAMLDTMEGCARRGADIIKQLLIFSRGSAGVRVPLPVRHLLREMEKIIKETFPRDIQPQLDTAPEVWALLGDATQIDQALLNLCVNARDAMPEGGTLTLGARNVTVDAAFAAMVPESKPGSYVCVSVTDTGSGITPEHLERIFDPFFTTKEIGKGTGLGLATVLGIVRGHEGFLQVNSVLGCGTTFDLYFPAASVANPAQPNGPATSPPPRGCGELILVVDDEAAVCDGLARILRRHGYEVLTARHGADGLAMYAQHGRRIRAVLTDMMMPVMNGPTMIRELRSQDTDVLVLGMSGLLDRRGGKSLEQVELAAMLTKPFGGDELLRVLQVVLD